MALLEDKIFLKEIESGKQTSRTQQCQIHLIEPWDSVTETHKSPSAENISVNKSD